MSADRPTDPSGVQDSINLANRIRTGDSQAEEELVQLFGPGVMTILQHRLRGDSVAQDVWQETFTDAIIALRRGKLREPEKLVPFIHSIARRKTGRHWRSPWRRLWSRESVSDLPASLRFDPEHGAIARERAGLVREALEGLAARDREVLIRIYFDDQETAEVREALSLEAGQLSVVKYRALARIEGALAKLGFVAAHRGATEKKRWSSE